MIILLCYIRSESVPWGWSVANMLVLKKVHEALGFKRCKRFSVGAAPIKMETMEYFMSLNIPIMPMYGEYMYTLRCTLYIHKICTPPCIHARILYTQTHIVYSTVNDVHVLMYACTCSYTNM